MSHADNHPVEFLAELALGALPASQAESIRAHVDTCDSCRDEFVRMERAVRFLPLAAEPVAPREASRTRVLERIRQDDAPPTMLPRRQGVPHWAMAVAAALVIAITGAVAFAAGRASDEADDGSADFQQLARAIAVGAADVSRAEADGARVSLVREADATRGFAWVEGLPALPEGQAYQAWLSRDGQTMEASDVFTQGEGGLWLSSEQPMENYTLLAFTIEDARGATAPTAAPFLVVPLSAQ